MSNPTGFLQKLKAHKSALIYGVLSCAFLAAFLFQVMGYYVSATNSNIESAIKTGHMMVFDLESGKALSHLPNGKAPVEEAPAHDEHAAEAPAPTKQLAEITFIFTHIGEDANYSETVKKLPLEFIAAFTPYAIDSYEASMQETEKNRPVFLDMPTTGKLALGAEDSEFVRTNKLDAAVSRIYSPEGIFTVKNDEAIKNYANGNELEFVNAEKSIYIPSSATAGEVQQKLMDAETVATSNQYIIIVAEPNPETVKAVTAWYGSLETKGFKLTPAIRHD